MLQLEKDLGYARQGNPSAPEIIGRLAQFCKLVVGEAMGPTFWIIGVVIRVPYGGTGDVGGKMLVGADLMVERGMLA